MSAYIIISLNVFDSRHTVSMLGKTKWNHLTLMQVKRWIFSEITGQAWTCLPWIRFSVNTTGEPAHGNRTNWCSPSRCLPLDRPLHREELWVTRLMRGLNVRSKLQVIQISTVTVLWGDKLCLFFKVQRMKRKINIRTDRSHSEYLKDHFWLQGKEHFDIITSAHDWWFCSISIIFSSLKRQKQFKEKEK